MPEVGIYNSPEVNAFATGAGKNSSLVAFSTGILHRMNRDEVEGVIGHEIAHIANGDMVTMTLIQGVLNTFVIFFARLAAYAVASMTRRGDSENSNVSPLAKMIAALRRLQENAERTDEETAPQLAAFKISSRKSFLNLFTTHPPLEERIRRLSESI
ncbi:hypothetical protein CHS0354_006869 [Potamilus streckersoni]|uniref:Peptidase M48 domain-containing protein n=1 Tax=Potamilus streckersoni TaxID=2493646 RepID=A0AAE0TFN1_9BIVA|nr:hypothetical protein CHS0354_006869 [Potamilus streckersoni]